MRIVGFMRAAAAVAATVLLSAGLQAKPRLGSPISSKASRDPI